MRILVLSAARTFITGGMGSIEFFTSLAPQRILITKTLK